MQDDPVGQPGPQTGAISGFQLPFYPDARRRVAHLSQAKAFQLIGQEILNTLGAGYEKDMLGQNQLLVFWIEPVSRRNSSKTRIRAVIVISQTYKKSFI
jgi:hypothetical protein